MADKKAEALKIVEDEVEVPTSSRADHEAWFDGNIHHYKTLAAVVAATLKSTLDGHGISYVDIPYREKGKKSFLKKIDDKKKKKDYSPDDMTDLAGIRVITLIESDIQKVSDLIHKLFNVHKEDSVNKTESLGEDKVGYRSVHFVCDIGEAREELPEWKFLKGRCFEIQVRTALMHAWAEIEHDRGYKLGGKLPSDLARRFGLLSGLLESADLEFNRLTVEIEEYAKSLDTNIKENNLDIELTTLGVSKLIKKRLEFLNYMISPEERLSTVIKELEDFGIYNLNDFDKEISNLIKYISKDYKSTEIGIIRAVMMFSDLDKYFNKVWINSEFKWEHINKNKISFLQKRYPDLNLEKYLHSLDIDIIE
ncbi:hypothetical protein [Acinetobacter sp. PK01]|uniref:GTP pyrophosphokinase n=1 Tax=Acinetobacter sp. PK01 TaxID=2930198 RepID=UPI001FB637C6|nr:hypothetical protein [Acinetobacter sp. PK01]UOG18689.1 hypothetical protein MP622_03495 [Acinetobacter sp. PK01]